MAINAGKSTDGVPDRGFDLYIVSIVMVIVAGLFVIARLAGRLSRSRLGWDDHTIVAALISSIGLSVAENLAVVNGYGKHVKSLTHKEMISALKWFYIAQILYKVVITLYRISFLCLYLRLFLNKAFRLTCYSGIVFTALCGTAFILATIFQCTPIAFTWDRTLKPAHCINSEAFWLSYAVINIVSDVAILTLPLFQIRHLQLPRRDKFGIMLVFLMGSFVCVTTIIRTTTLARSAAGDPTWSPLPATVWSVVEANTGIICACLPMLKQHLAVLFPRLFRSKTNNDSEATRIGTHWSNEKGASHQRSDLGYTPWARPAGTNVSHVVGGQHGDPNRSDSEERMIEEHERHGIARTVDVSVTDHSDTELEPSMKLPYHAI